MPNTPLAVLSRVEKVTTAFLAKDFLKTETVTRILPEFSRTEYVPLNPIVTTRAGKVVKNYCICKPFVHCRSYLRSLSSIVTLAAVVFNMTAWSLVRKLIEKDSN